MRRVVSKEIKKQKANGIGTTLFYLMVALALFQGYQIRDVGYIDAENGLGYALGIVGGVLMLLLLLYPLRKRMKSFRKLGPVKYWFNTHMVFGVLGPTLVLFHCNFSLGATNSNVALFSMVIVASSGLLGRYFYSKIHHGLYGSQATIQEFQQESKWLHDELVNELGYFSQLEEKLKEYETSAARASQGWFSVVAIPLFTLKAKFSAPRLLKEMRMAMQNEISDTEIYKAQYSIAKKNMRTYLLAVRKAAAFSLYKKLFSAWHVLHFPLFIMMVITTIFHVLAVHMY